ALIRDHRPVEPPRHQEPDQRRDRERRVEDLRAGREHAKPARAGREVFHGSEPALIAASTIRASRFTPTAIEFEEIDAPETMSMSFLTVIGSLALLPTNCARKRSLRTSSP